MLEIGNILRYYLNGEEEGTLYKETITSDNIKYFKSLITDNTIEVFSIE